MSEELVESYQLFSLFYFLLLFLQYSSFLIQKTIKNYFKVSYRYYSFQTFSFGRKAIILKPLQKYPELKNNFITPTLEEITLNQSLKEIAKSNNANFVDILNLICLENESFNLINDKYIHKDNSHLRPFFTKDSLQPWLIEKTFSEKYFNE